jgi:hypothetical protein
MIGRKGRQRRPQVVVSATKSAKIDTNDEETKSTKDGFDPISSVLLRALRFFVV